MVSVLDRDVKLIAATPAYRTAFLQVILNVDAGRDQTIAVIRAVAVTEYGEFDSQSISKVVSVLLQNVDSLAGKSWSLALRG